MAAANVAAETVTVADVAALARGQPVTRAPSITYTSPFTYEHDLSGYLGR